MRPPTTRMWLLAGAGVAALALGIVSRASAEGADVPAVSARDAAGGARAAPETKPAALEPACAASRQEAIRVRPFAQAVSGRTPDDGVGGEDLVVAAELTAEDIERATKLFLGRLVVAELPANAATIFGADVPAAIRDVDPDRPDLMSIARGLEKLAAAAGVIEEEIDAAVAALADRQFADGHYTVFVPVWISENDRVFPGETVEGWSQPRSLPGVNERVWVRRVACYAGNEEIRVVRLTVTEPPCSEVVATFEPRRAALRSKALACVAASPR